MSVKLTSPALGQVVGYIYTGALETWLLANGYAKRDADTTPTSYTGVGVANTGATGDTPANDPTLASNREAPYYPLSPDENSTIANDGANLNDESFPLARFDFDAGGVDTEAPVVLGLDPTEGPLAAGTRVRIYGDNLEGVTGVTFDAVAATALDVTTANEGFIEVTAPAGTAGPATVVVTDPVGADTEVGIYTYVA